MASSKTKNDVAFDGRNWYIYRLYVRKEYDACLRAIEDQLRETKGLSEYPIYVKALIQRQRGNVQESLELFQAAACLSPHNPQNLKQVGKSLHLLGKHQAAIEVYEEAHRVVSKEGDDDDNEDRDDWELWHNMGQCFMYLKKYEKSIECLERANLIGPHDATYLELGKVLTLTNDLDAAVEAYMDGLHFSPENSEIMTEVGLLYLRQGESTKAFEFLANALSIDPTSPKAILAAGSIVQDNGDMDVALKKYRNATKKAPNSPQLWNNIGMCFFGKQRYVAAIACLKRALYLDPFEWIVSYNLGLAFLNTGQYASAYHHLSASVSLKSNFASAYMYLGIALNRLGDFENACGAFEKAIATDPKGHLAYLNYAVILHDKNRNDRAREVLGKFEALYEKVDMETKLEDTETRELLRTLKESIGC